MVEDVRGLGPHDHVCWPFDDQAEFQAVALSFLEDGLRLGQRAMYASDASADDLRRELDPIGALDDLIAAGTLELISLTERYRAGRVAGPRAQAEAYAEAAMQAVADGYTGLRVAADATSLVLDADARREFVEYEHRVDRLMAEGLPFSAMCGYDRRRMDADAVDTLVCIHPVSRAGDDLFHISALPDGRIALEGDLDLRHADRFELLLDIAVGTLEEQPVVVDCRDLSVGDDARALLERCADDHGVTLAHLG